jgi:hypothetical protein
MKIQTLEEWLRDREFEVWGPADTLRVLAHVRKVEETALKVADAQAVTA